MQFNLTSDYAIRTVMYLAKNNDRPCTSLEIEENMGVPSLYLYKTTRKLRDVGIITTVQGSRGGYKLVKNPDEISLYDIISLTEKTMFQGSYDNMEENDVFMQRTGNVRRVFKDIGCDVRHKLRSVSIQSLIEN